VLNIVSRDRALLALYGFGDVPDYGIINTLLSRMRNRLAAVGVPVVIENLYGEGWYISRESAHAFDSALSQREAA
jgi:DNA-binding response OmpR family regulator